MLEQNFQVKKTVAEGKLITRNQGDGAKPTWSEELLQATPERAVDKEAPKSEKSENL